jgi:hypothetical protein
MLGDQIAELKGKITGQRVLDIEVPMMDDGNKRIHRGQL